VADWLATKAAWAAFGNRAF